jgi:uncharacterized protein (DUF58 family)
MSATCVALLVVSGLAAVAGIAGLEVEPPEASAAFAGRTMRMTLRLARRRRPPGVARDLLLELQELDQPRTQPFAFVPLVDRGAVVTVAGRTRFWTRGRRLRLRLIATSRAPLGLWVASARWELPVDIRVAPRLVRLQEAELEARRATGQQPDLFAARHGDEDIRALEEWRPGKSLRRVHWKKSARVGRTILREMEGDSRPPVHVFVSRYLARPDLARGSRSSELESTLVRAVAVMRRLLIRGHRVRLSVVGLEVEELAAVTGVRNLLPLVAPLSEVDPVKNLAPTDLADLARDHTRRGEALVLVGGRARPW